jgi:acyl-CoA thioester hydrolase
MDATTCIDFKELCMSERIVTYRGIIYPWHCDHMGHMNVMWYAGKFDEASWHLLANLGLTQSRFRRDGSGMAAVQQNIAYKRELHAGDLVTVHSAVLEVHEKSIHMSHQMRNDETEEIAATADIVGVHIDAAARRSRPLPSDIRNRAILMMHESNFKSSPAKDLNEVDERLFSEASCTVLK